MEFVTDALGRFPGFEIEVTQVPCVRGDIDGGDLPTLFYPGDSYGAPTAPVVTSRPVSVARYRHFCARYYICCPSAHGKETECRIAP